MHFRPDKEQRISAKGEDGHHFSVFQSAWGLGFSYTYGGGKRIVTAACPVFSLNMVAAPKSNVLDAHDFGATKRAGYKTSQMAHLFMDEA